MDRSEDRSEASCQQQKASGSLLHFTLLSLHRRPTSCRRMHLASPKVLRLTERTSQELWRGSILTQNTHQSTHTPPMGGPTQEVLAAAIAAADLQSWQGQIEREKLALPCAKHGWLPLPGQDGALPDDFGALLPDDLGGLLLPDLGAGHTGDFG